MPGSPTSDTSIGDRSRTVRPYSSLSIASSTSRPTIGVDGGVSASAPPRPREAVGSQISSGSCLPFTVAGGSSRYRNRSRVAR